MKIMGKMVPDLFKALFKKPVTIAYPAEAAKVAARFRGGLKFHADNCIGCKLCMRNCPAGAIEIIKVADKEFKAVVLMDKCIFCGQCVDSCNKAALESTPEFELAASNRKSLKVEI